MTGPRVDLITSKMRSKIFDNLLMMNDLNNPKKDSFSASGNYFIVYPNILKADNSALIQDQAMKNLSFY